MNRKSVKNQPRDGRQPDNGRSPGRVIGEGDVGQDSRWTGPNPYAVPAICAFLVLAVALVFGQTLQHDFVNYDDHQYVYENPQVTKGLTAEGIGWAFTSFYANNWHPLTWLSHMLDCQLYGLESWGHHLSSVLLHAATAVLLFLVLRRMTGNVWPSALAAVVFAIHPLHVQSVAWVAERKDVLSGLFFVLTLAAYAGYVRRQFSLARYLTVIALFALGLMSKPMLVTLPFVLLLLDYWPLDRMTPRATSQSRDYRFLWKLVIEKLPLLALAAASCVVTTLAQGEAVASTEMVPIPYRIANALVAYVSYIGQFFYPTGLAVLYPHAGIILPVWKVVGALLIFTGICAAALALRRRSPYLFVGWFWYVGMLVPVIGLVQVGYQAMADRYTYLPQIGLCIAIAWGAAQAVASGVCRRWVCIAASSLAVLMLMGCAWQETSHWRDSETLWTQTLKCTSRNFFAHGNFGNVLARNGRFDEAISQYEAALKVKPRFPEALNNMGTALASIGKTDEALVQYRKALQLQPDFAEAHYNLGRALADRGQRDEAIAHFRKALEIKPQYSMAREGLQRSLSAHEMIPKTPAERRKLIDSRPNDAALLNDTAWILATSPDASIRDGDEAIEWARQAVEITNGQDPTMLDTLAAAYAEAGRFPEAVETAQKAIELATRRIQPKLVETIRARASLYRAEKPFRDAALSSSSSSAQPRPSKAE